MQFKDQFVGMTVKHILTNELGFSRKAITALKSRDDGILINGIHATVRAVISEGDVLSINYDDKISASTSVPSRSPVNIIFEDDQIIAVSKPSNMPTHQSHGHFCDTLANSLAYYYAEANRPFVFRAVNRLDRNTSGIVLIAKDRISASRLSKQIISGNIEKTYIAILDGYLPQQCGTIRSYIKRESESIITRCVCEEGEPGAKYAETEYRVVAQGNGLSLVIAKPITGRTHQLRVHFSSLGAPILGDDLYGKASDLIDRQALHALSLSFAHPQSNEILRIEAPINDDMQTIIDHFFRKDDIIYGK